MSRSWKSWGSLWGPVAAWCAVIFYLSSIPSLNTGWGTWDLILRKIAHVVEYGFLAVLLWRALEGSRCSLKICFWGTVIFGVLYALSDEWHQRFVPGRGPSWVDVLWDTLGTAGAAGFQYATRQNALSFVLARLGFWAKGSVLLLLVLGGTACTRLDYWNVQRLEKAGDYERAVKGFIELGRANPDTSLGVSSLYRAARLAGDRLGDYQLAQDLYNDIISRYGDRDNWGRKAEWAIFNTPNYFPLIPDAVWVMGDSQTGGGNARIETVCRALDGKPGKVRMSQQYYAGKRRIRKLSQKNVFEKVSLELRQYPSGHSQYGVLLKYPFERGQSWETQTGNTRYLYTIEDIVTVRVRAGRFENCLKVREQVQGIRSSWKVDYYAPGVGKVLTTLATPKSEKRNTELISYNLNEGQELYPFGEE